MANGKDLELALRIRADLKQGQAELKQLETALEQAGQQAQQAGAQMSTTATAVDRLGSESAAAAASVQSVGNGAVAASAGLAQQAAAMQRAGLTTGQYQQAMRMLPMQLTDVVTSLATGMPIWMVAIQQGGQIRDSFGGIGNAARAVVSAISPMAAAIGGAAVVGGTLLAAFAQGQREASAYAQALIMTGNAAGTTTDQLATMAARMDEVQGTQRQAAAALAEIAASGKIAGDQMEMVGTAAIAMERSTGRAVSDTVEEFAKLADEPSKASAELNQQYNYLTASVYRQIRALEEQGDKVGAARLAIETYGQVALDRSAQVEQQLGYLERAWRGVGDVAAEAWDAMLNIGRTATLQQQLQDAEASLERLRNRRLRNGTVDTRGIQAAEERVEALQQQIDDAADEAANQQLSARLNQDAIAGQQAGEQYLQTLKDETEQLRDLGETEKALEFIRKKRIGTESDLGRQILAQAKAKEDLEASNEAAEEAERAAERARREREQAVRRAAQDAERQHQQQERYVQNLERQATVLGMTAAEVRRYDLDQQDLTGTLRQNAEAQLAAIEAYEKQRQAIENTRTNAGLLAELLRSQGAEGEAARVELEAQFAQAMRDFEKIGNAHGIALMHALLPVRQARIQLDEIGKQIDKTFSATDRAESRISTELDAGLITEIEARTKILELRRQEADVLERQLPALREIAAQGGVAGEQALNQIGEIENKIILARNAATDFELALKNGLTGGIQEALVGLADGTLSLRDAVMSLVSSVADAMAQLAAQQLAEKATKGLMGLMGGGEGDAAAGAAAATATATAITTASSAGATAMGTGIATSATAGATAMGTGISTAGITAAGAMSSGILSAGTAAATAMASAITAASASGGLAGAGTGGGGGLLSSLGSLFGGSGGAAGGSGFATGGHVTGPGTTTSDSIPAMLSNWEYVTRAAVVQQPGALDFLHAFNARGMAALDDYARRVHHATGGLAGVPAPALPAPSLGSTRLAEPAKALSTTVKNAINLNLVDSPERIASILNTPPGVEAFTVMLSNDPARFRSILGIN